MMRSGSKGVSYSPDINDPYNFSFKESSNNPVVAGNKIGISGLRSFSLPRNNTGFSPIRYLQRLGAKVARTISLVSVQRRRRRRRSSSKVSSSNLTRSRTSIGPLDSHQAEAIEDCIVFINSSSSFHRSNSISGV
ncbi:josephin-like protein [Macadamia integrifolia]|uniref:josephin-like protein n=1 Tax=Macadamia integrifolia TaxID=60698 RepID=UPI001C52E399|nr:josephin-like protein [Macadamia integrifolia]